MRKICAALAKHSWRNGRLLVYIIGFTVAVVLDAKTPIEMADWLLQVILVWVAATWGTREEMTVVAAVGTITILAGLWSSPNMLVPLWIGALNRIVAIGVIWAIVSVSRARILVEAARASASAEIRVLKGLLPICAACKRIRSKTNQWHNLESFITDHSEAIFTHTYCPACVEKYFPGINETAEGAS